MPPISSTGKQSVSGCGVCRERLGRTRIRRRHELDRHKHGFDLRVEMLQPAARAHECSRCAGTRHEMRHTVVRLLPDLRRGPFEMRLPVRVVVVLVGVEIFLGMLGDQPSALVVSAVRTLQRVGFDDLRAVEPNQFLAFLGRVRGEAKRDFVPQRSPQRRIRDPGVSARRVDDRLVVKKAIHLPAHGRGANGSFRP